jgi:hypothetical protein
MAFKDYFDSTEPHYSMTRLLTFILVMAALVISFVVTYLGISTHPLIIENNGIRTVIPPDMSIINALNYLIITLLGFGLGAKISQKYGEVSLEKVIQTNNNGNGKDNGTTTVKVITPTNVEVQQTDPIKDGVK